MENLRTLFENEYPGKKVLFESLIKPIFVKANDTTLTDEQELSDSDKKQIKSFRIIAQVRGSFPITFADIELQDNVALKRSRVNIQNCVRKVMENDSNALIFFHFTDNAKEWRVSYVNKADSLKNSTSAKRYTYLCGPEHSCRTIAERFSTLEGLSTIKDENMLEAFAVAPLSDDFFNEYRKHYADLVEYISGKRFIKKGGKFVEEKTKKAASEFANAFNGDDKAVRDFVKKMLGRLVFLQFLQKKGWLGVPKNAKWGTGDKNFIYNLFKNADDFVKNDFLEQALEPLFFKSLNCDRGVEAIAPKAVCNIYRSEIRIPYLNGGLFEEDELDKKRVKFKKEHFESIFEFFNQYNFTIDETDTDDVEIGVDPEMLGKIFENLLEDNKDKGAFYTPKEIVQYMCRESLIAYLETETVKHEETASKDKIRNFVLNHEASSFSEKEKADILKALIDVKICDPAVGSGAFPMGMLNELLPCVQILTGEAKTRVELKKHIVKNNIYGVDIEKGAVDIARLRFWLAIIVDEEEPLPLPNLDYKIMQGNSLLESFEGIDLSDLTTKKVDELFDDADDEKCLVTTLQKYFDTSDHNAKIAHREAIKSAVLDLLEKRGISTAENKVKTDLSKLDLHENTQFFLWHTWFYDVFNRPSNCNGRNGFDIVIGNPPYIKEYENRDAFDVFREESPYYMGKMDLWYGFACKGLDLLTTNGHLCFIAQNNWTTSAGAKIMRNKVIKDSKICEMINFNDYMVFENADIQTMIMLFEKNNDVNNYNFDYRTLKTNAEKEDMLDLLEKKQTSKTKYLSPKINREKTIGKLLTFSNNDLIFEKIAQEKCNLMEKEATNGIHTHHDCVNKKIHGVFPDLELGKGIFVLSNNELNNLNLDKKEKSLIKPYFTSEQIERYYTSNKNCFWIIYTDSSFKNKNSMDNYPKLKSHFDKVGKAITSDNKPYGLHRAREEHFFKGEKIISQRKCVGRPVFSYSDFDCYVPAMYYIIKTTRWNMKFLTGVLNSKLIAYWLKNKGKMQGTNYQVDKEPLVSIPLPYPQKINNKIEQQIIALVDKILAAKKQDSSIDTTALESKIDELVYDLYGLTEEEKDIIRNN